MYHLRCLGEAALRNPKGELVHFRSRKHLALLVYLALNSDRAHRRERLAGLLWTDSNDSKARHSLSQALYAIRRLLDGAIRIEGEDLELRAHSLLVDTLQLERLFDVGKYSEVVDLYRGDFLEGFFVRGAQGFEDWAGRERSRVGAVAREALRRAIKKASECCDWLDVREMSERLIRLDPFDETAYSELMRALWMLGDRSAALDRFETLKLVLASDLQTTPSAETRALADRIRKRPVRGGWGGRLLLNELTLPAFEEPPFVGRQSELAFLTAEWKRVTLGHTRGVALVGTAGIGKSRLAEQFLRSLDISDVTIMQSRCFEAEQSIPYGPVAEALREGLERLNIESVHPFWLSETARIIPEIRDHAGELPSPTGIDVESGRLRFYEGIAQTLIAASESTPALIFIDDLHWADESSVALVHYLLRRVQSGLFVLLAFRPEESVVRRTDLQNRLCSMDGTGFKALTIESLNDTERRDLSRVLLGERNDNAIESITTKSGGNPLFTIEFARAVMEHNQKSNAALPAIPVTITKLIERRFTGLTAQAVNVMGQMAILGCKCRFRVLQLASRLNPLGLKQVISELKDNGIVTECGDTICFRHHVICDVAKSQITPEVAKVLHTRAARALIRSGAQAGEIALHLSSADKRTGAYHYALRGSNAAQKVYALEEACELLVIAIKHSPNADARDRLVARLGKLNLHLRNYVRARPLLKERHRCLIESRGSKVELIEAERDLILVDMFTSRRGMKESAHALRDLHCKLSPSVEAPQLEAEILRVLMWAAARSFQPSLVDEAIKYVKSIHSRTDMPSVRSRTARSLAIYAMYKGQICQAEEYIRDAQRLAHEADDGVAMVDCFVALSALLHRVLSVEVADEVISRGIPLAQRYSDPAHVVQLLCNCAACYMYLGNIERAEGLLEQVRQVQGNAHYFPDTTPSLLYNWGYLEYIKGNGHRAREKWLEALSASIEHGVLTIRLESLAGLGILALRNGELTTARMLAGKALRLARFGDYLIDQRFLLEDLIARLHFEEGNIDKALSKLHAAVESKKLVDKPFYLTAQLTRIELLQRVERVPESKQAMTDLIQEARKLKATWWIDQATQFAIP